MPISPRTIAAMSVGISLGIATLQIESLTRSGGSLILLLFPGLLGSMILAGNVHAFPLWFACIINCIFYFGLVWTIGYLGAKVRRKPSVEGRSEEFKHPF